MSINYLRDVEHLKDKSYTSLYYNCFFKRKGLCMAGSRAGISGKCFIDKKSSETHLFIFISILTFSFLSLHHRLLPSYSLLFFFSALTVPFLLQLIYFNCEAARSFSCLSFRSVSFFHRTVCCLQQSFLVSQQHHQWKSWEVL